MANPDARMSMIEHLRELRRRVIACVVILLAAFVVCYVFADPIFAWLARPLEEAMGEGAGRRMIYTGLPEAFLTKISLAFYSGVLFSFPLLAMQLYLFLAPGLYKREKMALVPFLVASPVLFLAGIALAYYYMLPLAWKFFLGFEQTGGSDALPVMLEARMSEYLSLVIQVLFAFGVSFQLPVLLTLLVRARLMSTEKLRRGRRWAAVILITVAAVITPPDALSQIALFVPLYLLYELSILAGTLMESRGHEGTRVRTS